MALAPEPARDPAEEARGRALELLSGPPWSTGSSEDQDARELLPALRRFREFDLLLRLCERAVRLHPREPSLKRLQVQALIETGQASAAIDVARAGLHGLPEADPEWSELHGLIGRAFKQVVMDARDPGDEASLSALRQSVDAYATPHLRNPGNTWHAINLVAMAAFALRMGLRAPLELEVPSLARRIIATLQAAPPERRDAWDAATLAEAHLALGDLPAVERCLRTYLADPRVSAFDVGSTLRQFTRVWGLKDATDPRLQGIAQALSARLLELPGAKLELDPRELTQQRVRAAPSREQLEAILGADGPQSYAWLKTGLERASAVCAVWAGASQRIGTGFLVRGCDVRPGLDEAPLVLTNFHVINAQGAGGALRPDDADIAFEAVDARSRHRIREVVWSSPADRHDACLVRLDRVPAGVTPLPVASCLPVVEADARVHVIGHPKGGDLHFSLQDNALLDHDGPPAGKRAQPEVWRVQYRAPTEKGSSGSPVFNRTRWEVIALHHAGGTLSRLNGSPGTIAANEGIGLGSIAAMGSAPA